MNNNETTTTTETTTEVAAAMIARHELEIARHQEELEFLADVMVRWTDEEREKTGRKWFDFHSDEIWYARLQIADLKKELLD